MSKHLVWDPVSNKHTLVDGGAKPAFTSPAPAGTKLIGDVVAGVTQGFDKNDLDKAIEAAEALGALAQAEKKAKKGGQDKQTARTFFRPEAPPDCARCAATPLKWSLGTEGGTGPAMLVNPTSVRGSLPEMIGSIEGSLTGAIASATLPSPLDCAPYTRDEVEDLVGRCAWLVLESADFGDAWTNTFPTTMSAVVATALRDVVFANPASGWGYVSMVMGRIIAKASIAVAMAAAAGQPPPLPGGAIKSPPGSVNTLE